MLRVKCRQGLAGECQGRLITGTRFPERNRRGRDGVRPPRRPAESV